MCRIVGIVGKSEVSERLFDGLKRLEYRGYDSAGICTLENGEFDRRRAEGKLKNLRIQGFIDGAMATDERVALNVAAEYQEEETFTQRAIRTRLSNRLMQYGSYYAEFCLGGPVTLAEVVGRVGANIKHIHHDRGRVGMGVFDTVVTVELETRGPEHLPEITSRLRAAGYRLISEP